MLILSSNFVFFSDRYRQNPLDCLLEESRIAFVGAHVTLHRAFKKFFEDNSIDLKPENWINEVQKALTISPSSKGDEEEMERTPAFNLLCQKAEKWNKCLSDIQKLRKRFDYSNKYYWGKYEHEDDDEDEDEKQEKEQMLKLMKKAKQRLIEKAERMIKIMGDIAVDIGIPYYTELIQGTFYDIGKGGDYRRRDGSKFNVKVPKDPSDAQLKLSPFASDLAHPSPEELIIDLKIVSALFII